MVTLSLGGRDNGYYGQLQLENEVRYCSSILIPDKPDTSNHMIRERFNV